MPSQPSPTITYERQHGHCYRLTGRDFGRDASVTVDYLGVVMDGLDPATLTGPRVQTLFRATLADAMLAGSVAAQNDAATRVSGTTRIVRRRAV